ncbi:MAG: Crp/Fnr family transcriptional regulator [Bacteroidales bacterium]|nr:Crp/Fnr family transcriptional regulator [Bacteroidales bacterium]
MKNSFVEPCNPGCSFCFLNFTDVLCKTHLFAGVNPEEIGRMIKMVHHQVRKYSKNDLIAQSGDDYHSLYFIVEGNVVGEIIDFEGKVLRIEELHAPDTIASAFLFGDHTQLPVNVTALSDTKILILPRQDLLRLFRENERILRNFLDMVCNRTQNLTRKIKMLSLGSIRSKFALHLLNQLGKSSDDTIILKNSQSELAEIFGVARPSLARVIREMNEEGLIRSSGKTIKVLDKNQLSSLLN